mgnify:CR=1 FL=1
MNLPKEDYDRMVAAARASQCVQQHEFEHEGKKYIASVNTSGECLENEVIPAAVEPKE